jgi:hypothetical protein
MHAWLKHLVAKKNKDVQRLSFHIANSQIWTTDSLATSQNWKEKLATHIFFSFFHNKINYQPITQVAIIHKYI